MFGDACRMEAGGGCSMSLNITTKTEALKILKATPGTFIEKHSAEKFPWKGSGYYTGRSVNKFDGDLAVFVDKRYGSNGAYCLFMCVTRAPKGYQCVTA